MKTPLSGMDHRVVLWAALLIALGQGIACPSASAQVRATRVVYPIPMYYGAFGPFAEGDYVTASKAFQTGLRSGVRSPQGRWIDSICYFAMIGECYYQVGDYATALDNFDNALQLALAYGNWMQLVQFPQTIRPSHSSALARITWGPSTRTSQIGDFPDRMHILRGRLDNERVLQEGGVVVNPEFVSVNVHEIVRCTALALRRRNELLGPVCPQDRLTAELVAAYGTGLGPTTQWAQAWYNVQHGLALAGAGRTDEAARLLQSSIVIGGYDHPLTATALLELGKMMAADQQADKAATMYFEATLAAAAFYQTSLAEEAFRLASGLHIASGKPGPYAPLLPAAAWAHRERFDHLKASLFIQAADNMISLGDLNGAKDALAKAQQTVKRRTARNPRLAARFQFQTARLALQSRVGGAAHSALKAAMTHQTVTSLRMFHIGLVDGLYESGTLSARATDQLYDQLLVDPRDEDWINDPLDTLTVLTAPLSTSLETWFQIALSRRETEKAIEISDRIRRRRFYSSRPLGGRLLALRWLLAAPDEMLDQPTILRRKDLLVRNPELQKLDTASRSLRQDMRGVPIATDNDEAVDRLRELATELSRTSARQETILYDIALRREPSPLLFPPQRSTLEIRQGLASDELALVYFAVSGQLHAFMLSREKYAHWEVDAPRQMQQRLVKLLRGIGNNDENGAVGIRQLANTQWEQFAAELRDVVIDRRQVGFWNRFSKLVIVPDGAMWYVPFEVLPTNNEGDYSPLLAKTQIRYAPTAGLTLPDKRNRRPNARSPVVLGELYPGTGAGVTIEQFKNWKGFIDGLSPLPRMLPASTALLRCTWDQLIVLDDLDNRKGGPYQWIPARADGAKSDSTLNRWFRLPWGGPLEVVLPGYHTAAEDGLRRAADGSEIFLPVTAMMANGARTILLSRWRTGGQASYDLMREYLQEREQLAAPQAWQRAVLVTRRTELSADLEPRLDTSDDEPLPAEHPFFWSGYLLIDAGQTQEKEPEAVPPAA